jgi:hypothetical protein
MTAPGARHAAFLMVALLASLRLTAGATAAPSEAQRKARAHFQSGEERFKAGAFADALAAYQAGYDVLPLPGFLINVAQCQRRLGDLKTARASYQKFVLVAPDSPLVPQVRSMIAEIDGLLAELDKNKPAPADPPKGSRRTEGDRRGARSDHVPAGRGPDDHRGDAGDRAAAGRDAGAGAA